MSHLTEICKLVKENWGSDFHIATEQPVFYKVKGTLKKFDKMVLDQDQIKKIILATSSPKAREILGKMKQVTYATNVDEVGRLRLSVYFERNKFAISARILSDNFLELDDIGFNESARKIISQPSGLILVGSPSGEGKTSTIAAILNFINKHFEKSIFTVENPVEFVFKDKKSSFIQRSIPVDSTDFYNGLCEAYRIMPDVVMTDSIGYPDAMDQALSLAESGRLVIAATGGGDSQQIIERLINSRNYKQRDYVRNQIALQLKLVISQRLIPTRCKTDRIAIFDTLILTGQLKTLIRSNSMSMFRALHSQGEVTGMKTFDSELAKLLRKQAIDKKTAKEFSVDKSRFS